MKAITITKAIEVNARRKSWNGRYAYYFGPCAHCGKPMSLRFEEVPMDAEDNFITDRSAAVKVGRVGATCFKRIYGGTALKTLTGSWPGEIERYASDVVKW